MGGFCGRVCPVFVEANVALVNVEKLRGDGGVRSAHVVHVDVVVDVCVALGLSSMRLRALFLRMRSQ